MKCNKCGCENPETAKFCNECGVKIERVKEGHVLCASCGKQFPEEYPFCPFCGAKVAEKAESGQEEVEATEEAVAESAETEVADETEASEQPEEIAEEATGKVPVAEEPISESGAESETVAEESAKPSEEETEQSAPAKPDKEKILCPSCNAEIRRKSKFCPVCGANVAEKLKELEEQKAQEKAARAAEAKDTETPKCAQCGADIAPNAKFCPVCGAKQERKAVCANCGAELPPNIKFCPNCGTPRNGGQAQTAPSTSQTVQQPQEPRQADFPPPSPQASGNFVVPFDKEGKQKAMLEAIKRNDVSAVEAILNSGYKVDKRIDGVTPLGLAAIFDSADVARFLIQRGAHINGILSNTSCDPQHKPIMLAALNNSLAVAKILIDAGADVNSTNSNARTAMKLAELHGHTEMMSLLQRHGANLNSVRSVLFKGVAVAGVLAGTPGAAAVSVGGLVRMSNDTDRAFLRERYL